MVGQFEITNMILISYFLRIELIEVDNGKFIFQKKHEVIFKNFQDGIMPSYFNFS